jgi:hypothetical protein
VWFVKIEGRINGWFVLCMGNGVKDRFMMAYDKTNERWEL